ncbi:putative Zn-dependent peptidase [Arcanobacterium wilhelmae]|uniref:Zn-dependent peptidase n=1 Tax=Arcanobacterium wilhelmae TaxID=1803177 RepID=A0ABT9N9A4_9ACTO|nr:pitrilysin family protein [Arcanobacterium wilhelmae]MDP9800289.1 putative Zn-dependent peptidase [Arcanobacterium wilhelmae]WFN89726.1 pitrilysin family protein [Arcanobacterium wilhelmae]
MFSRIPFTADQGDIRFEENGVIGRRSILPGGIRVLTEKVPGQRSVSLALWIGAGSRDEAPGHEGSTHFLEHLLFKGTHNRTAKEISELGDFLGGAMNAATARAYTNYYGRVFADDMPQLLELLIDMVTASRLDEADMELERGVILEELAASEDDVSEVAEQGILPLVWGSHPLARPVGGSRDEVRSLAPEAMRSHYRENYRSSELVVTAAGDVDHDELCAMVLALLRHSGWDLTEGAEPAPRRRTGDIAYTAGSEKFIEHPGRQTAVVVGMPGLALSDADEQAAIVLDTVLGGGQSSRMFQEVREKRGLAYSTYSWMMSNPEGGLFALEAQCQPEVAREVATVMGECLDEIAANGITEQELLTAFNQRRAQLVFSSETNGFRRSRLGFAELIRGEIWSIEENLRAARGVTREDVQRLAQRLASGPRSLVIAGEK